MARKPKAPITGDYEVGYGRPPVAGRFGPGNPGRPKSSSRKQDPYNIAQMLDAAMKRPRKVKRGDEIVEMKASQLMIEQMITMATSGTARDKALMLGLIAKHLPQLLVPPPQEMKVTYHRAPGSEVELPPAILMKRNKP